MSDDDAPALSPSAGPMLCLTVHGPGVLSVEEREAPPAPLPEHPVEVLVELGGICGSDLHYFEEGRVADRVISEPLILGHELVGRVTESGPAAERLAVGTRVAIDPSSPCGSCPSCASGHANRCSSPRFLGSAATLPHVHGGFRERIVLDARQCVPVPAGVASASAVFCEPLAVAVHALGRAGPVAGRAVLVTGAGPIGALTAALAARSGAEVTITDLHAGPLELAAGLASVSPVLAGGPLPDADIAIEASGSSAALADCLEHTLPGGRVVAVGMFGPGGGGISPGALVTGELELLGSFRFTHEEFLQALDLIAGGFDPLPLVAGTFQLADGLAAFRRAAERERPGKVQLQISV